MLCQTIELTKYLEKCPLTLPKVCKNVKTLGKRLYFGFVRERQLILITLQIIVKYGFRTDNL